MAYNPDPGAVALQDPITFARFLSQRDISIQVPANYVSQPGVVLTAACFSSRRYDDAAFAKCFSNLLAAGFRRIEADLYWDVSQSDWSLCPVELQGAAEEPTSSTSSQTSASSTTTQLASHVLSGRTDLLSSTETTDTIAGVKEVGSKTLTVASATSATSSSESLSTTVTLNAIPLSTPTATPPGDGIIYQAAPYTCTIDANFALLVSILSQHFYYTQTTTNATTVVLTLNLHAAASITDPLGPAQQPSDAQLPGTNSLLSSILNNNASTYIYTPDELHNQRSSLNSSRNWFAVEPSEQPIASYFNVTDKHDDFSTPNGWPSESYIEQYRMERLLVGFGRTDPQMQNYNFTADESTIFPSNYLTSSYNISYNAAGNITAGCFFKPLETGLSELNSSWAVATLGNTSIFTGSSYQTTLNQAASLTSCGITPLLNGTLLNLTADQDYFPYTAFVEATTWAWAANQPPINISTSSDARCATMNSSALGGSWQVSDCSASHYGACRVGNEPYKWEITYTTAPYDRIHHACGSNTSFDTPRTALENNYLLHTWLSFQSRQSESSSALLWLDFNDLDVENCWVLGQNNSCPYLEPRSDDTRQIVVPTVAGIIIFVLAGLTLLVKYAGNRQTKQRKWRRGDDGWDYEGVPS